MLRDLFGLSGENESALVADLRKRFDLELAALTRGEKGCLVQTPDEEVVVAGVRVQVVDTVGAGDAFTAGLVCAVLEGTVDRGGGAIRQPAGGVCGRQGRRHAADCSMRDRGVIRLHPMRFGRTTPAALRLAGDSGMHDPGDAAEQVRRKSAAPAAVLRVRAVPGAVVQDRLEPVVLVAADVRPGVQHDAAQLLPHARRMKRVLRAFTSKPSSRAAAMTCTWNRLAPRSKSRPPEKARSSA